MADGHGHRRDENSDRVLRWLYEHRAEFEGDGISERSLASAVGLSERDATEAVDRLENREALARVPRHDEPGAFTLQPARGWADVRDELGGGAAA
jgi:hypothetical protein